MAAGCAAPKATPLEYQQVTGPIHAGNQGGAWELLYAPVLESSHSGAEVSRRDAALNIREPAPVTELGMWPEHPRPRLGQTRRLFLPRRADDVIYFREGPPPLYYRTWWVWH